MSDELLGVELGPQGIHVAHFVIDGGIRSARRPPDPDKPWLPKPKHKPQELRKEGPASATWIPVAPACHYASGGVATDLHGRTSVPGLYACGNDMHSVMNGAYPGPGITLGPRTINSPSCPAGSDRPESSRTSSRTTSLFRCIPPWGHCQAISLVSEVP